MKEVFFSDYLRKKAKKSLVACVAWAVVAMTLLLAGIVTGVAVILVSGLVAVVVALFVAATRGPVLYDLSVRNPRRAGAQSPSSRVGAGRRVHRLLQPPLERQREDLRHRLHPRRSLRPFRLRGKAPSRPHSLPERSLGADQGRSKRHSLPGSARRPFRSTIPQYQKAQGVAGAGSDGLWLHGAVVFTNPRAVLDIEGLRWVKAIAVKDLEQILSERTVLSAEQIDSINARLAAFVKVIYG